METIVGEKFSMTDRKEKYMQKLSAAPLDLASRVERVEDSAAEADQLVERW